MAAPACRFWNVIAWNQFMAGHPVTDGRISVNHGSAVPNADGSVTVVITPGIAQHPNAISTLGELTGNLAFRWFLAEEVPECPVVEVVPLNRAPNRVR